MKLLIVGHISATGFGTVTRRLGEEFLERGVDVRIIAVNHRGDPVQGTLAGRVWPATLGMGDGFGADIIPLAITGQLWARFGHAEPWVPDAMLVVSDFTGLLSHIGKRLHPAWLTVPVFHYMPVEGDNFPVDWGEIWNNPGVHESIPEQFRRPDISFHPVAMSEYGAKVIGDLIGRPVPHVYHGTDTDVFHPVGPFDPILYDGKTLRTKEDCRAAFGIDPRAKVILRTDRNVVRKFYYRFAEVVTAVHEREPDLKAIVHCAPIDAADGLNFYQEIARQPREAWGAFGLTNAHDTFTGLPVEGMVALYNAADLYVSTTGGEGFGLNLAESLACGVPVVVTDWAADAETVGPGGVLVPPLIDRYGEPVRYHSTYGMDWAVPDPRGFVDPIVELLNKPHRRKALGEAGRAHVRRSFSWGRAADQFIDLFQAAVPLEVAA